MASITFGSGKLFFKHPTTSQVYQIGILDDVSLNFESSTKEKYGNNQFPIASVITSRKVSGKATFAQINGALIATLMSGTVSAGRNIMADNVFNATSFTVSPTGTGFVSDYGVVDAAGNPMSLTASAPAVGSYSHSNGVYTFNASEPMSGTISYSYSTGSGQSFLIQNAPMGSQTNFSAFLQEKSADGEYFGIELYSVVIPSLNFGFKAEDFSTQDLSFSAQVNGSGQIGKVYSE